MVLGLRSAQAADPAPDPNWPQWRGPLATGAAPKANPPLRWDDTKNVRWKAAIPGSGTATPIVWGDRVFVQTAINTGKKGEAAAAADVTASPDPPPGPPGRRGGRGMFGGPKPTELYQFVLLCLDRKTGKPLWQRVLKEEVPHEGHHPTEGSFASNSPVTDGEHVYAYFGSRGLFCLDMDGNPVWSRDLGKMRVALGFGEGSSPALWGDRLVVNWDNEAGSFITALDKKSGEPIWKVSREERTSWATPLIVDFQGKPQVITAATQKIRGYDLETGKVIWECGGLTRNVIPSPVAGDGVIYAMSGFQGNSAIAIRLGRTGDLTDTDAILWKYSKKTPYVPSPLLYNGKIYFFAVNSEILTCLDAKTGKPLIEGQRVEGLVGVYASPVGAAGRVYLVGRNGAVVVLNGASDKLDVIATNQINDKFDASPAVAGNELFLRGRETLYCIASE